MIQLDQEALCSRGGFNLNLLLMFLALLVDFIIVVGGASMKSNLKDIINPPLGQNTERLLFSLAN